MADLWGVPMKWISFALLVVQTVSVIFAIRLSRIWTSGPKYLNTTAVFCTEVEKIVLSGLLLVCESGSLKTIWLTLTTLLKDPKELACTGLPCALYCVQNNLLFIALSNLSGAEYQVTYQLKILSTALLSVLVLGRVLRIIQWASLLLLTVGVILIQWRGDGKEQAEGYRLFGLAAVLGACLTSGLAGVAMEKLMKREGVSMWATNLRVAIISAIVALVGAFMKDSAAILEDGFFQGYSRLVWLVVFLQAAGGLVIASVMKYADNILKCFGNALSISISCLVSAIFLREFVPDRYFALGTACVLLATCLYGMPESALGRLAGRTSEKAEKKAETKKSKAETKKSN